MIQERDATEKRYQLKEALHGYTGVMLAGFDNQPRANPMVCCKLIADRSGAILACSVIK